MAVSTKSSLCEQLTGEFGTVLTRTEDRATVCADAERVHEGEPTE
jgi:hypothetical protein